MSDQQDQIPSCSYKLCKKALWCVFNTIEFDNSKIGWIFRKSYFGNLRTMLKYAEEKNIDKIEYILGIRDILLKNKHVHEL